MPLSALNSDVWGVVLPFCARASLASLACAHRSLAAEMAEGGAQQHTWKMLLARDWGVPQPLTQQQQEQQEQQQEDAAGDETEMKDEGVPLASPAPSGSGDEDPDLPAGLKLPELQPGESWRGAYRRHCEHFGRAASAYARIAPLWRRLLDWLEAHKAELPAIAASLPPTFAPAAPLSTFAAGARVAGGASLPPSSIDWESLVAALGEAQVEWRVFETQLRAQWRASLAEEERRQQTAESKRQSKRERSSHAAAEARGDTEGSSSSSASSSPSRGAEVAAPAAASDSAAQALREFELAAGLAPLPAAEQMEQAAVESAAAGLDLHLDDDVLCSWLLHNGQSTARVQDDAFTGLLGFYSFYDFGVSHRLLPFQVMLKRGISEAQQEAAEKFDEAKRARAKSKRSKRASSAPQAGAAEAAASSTDALVAAAADSDVLSGVELLLPLTRSPLGASCSFFVRCSTGAIVRQLNDGSLHEVAPSYYAFFSRFVSDLESGMFGFTRRHGISRFPMRSDTGSVTTTRGVRVQVSVLFVPEQSTPGGGGEQPRYFFTYHVRIEHDGSTPLRARLASRHWIIEDATGHVEEVQGPGVVGFTPEIYPGAPLFTYESCCPLPTPTGRMRGSFRYVLEGGEEEEFDAMINPFVFDTQRNYC